MPTKKPRTNRVGLLRVWVASDQVLKTDQQIESRRA